MPCALSFENNYHGTLDNYAASFELVCSVSHISHFIIIRELHGDKNLPPPPRTHKIFFPSLLVQSTFNDWICIADNSWILKLVYHLHCRGNAFRKKLLKDSVWPLELAQQQPQLTASSFPHFVSILRDSFGIHRIPVFPIPMQLYSRVGCVQNLSSGFFTLHAFPVNQISCLCRPAFTH